MVRGPSWDAQELQIAARAYKMATEDEIRGADQTTLNFGRNILRYVRQFQPRDLLNSDRRYGNRENGEVNILIYLKKKCFNSIQKFQKEVKKIERKEPSGVSDVDIHCMAIAVHLKLASVMDYDFTAGGRKEFNPAVTWNLYLAWLEVRHLPKFTQSPQEEIVAAQTARVNQRDGVASRLSASIAVLNDSDGDDDNNDNGNFINGIINDDANNLGTKMPAKTNDFNDTTAYAVTAGKSTPRAARGIQKSKEALKKNLQVVESLGHMKCVSTNISLIAKRIDVTTNAMQKKRKLQCGKEVISLLERKYKLTTDPDEKALIMIKINQKYDERLYELEQDGIADHEPEPEPEAEQFEE